MRVTTLLAVVLSWLFSFSYGRLENTSCGIGVSFPSVIIEAVILWLNIADWTKTEPSVMFGRCIW